MERFLRCRVKWKMGSHLLGYIKPVEEAIANLKESTELYLEEFPLPNISRSILTTFEVANV